MEKTVLMTAVTHLQIISTVLVCFGTEFVPRVR